MICEVDDNVTPEKRGPGDTDGFDFLFLPPKSIARYAIRWYGSLPFVVESRKRFPARKLHLAFQDLTPTRFHRRARPHTNTREDRI